MTNSSRRGSMTSLALSGDRSERTCHDAYGGIQVSEGGLGSLGRVVNMTFSDLATTVT